MTLLAQGRRASLVLDVGQVYRISTPGQATVTPAYGAPAGTTTVTAASQDFGPYSAPAKLELVAVAGDTEYSLRALRPAQMNDAGALVTPDGGLQSFSEVTPYVNMTATGTAVTGPCELAGYDCTVAAGNITIYDGTSTAGAVIVPTTALAVGRNEFRHKRALTAGCHVVLSGAATVNVLVG